MQVERLIVGGGRHVRGMGETAEQHQDQAEQHRYEDFEEELVLVTPLQQPVLPQQQPEFAPGAGGAAFRRGHGGRTGSEMILCIFLKTNKHAEYKMMMTVGRAWL